MTNQTKQTTHAATPPTASSLAVRGKGEGGDPPPPPHPSLAWSLTLPISDRIERNSVAYTLILIATGDDAEVILDACKPH